MPEAQERIPLGLVELKEPMKEVEMIELNREAVVVLLSLIIQIVMVVMVGMAEYQTRWGSEGDNSDVLRKKLSAISSQLTANG
ncbi:MAG: hypothetical protein ABIR03_03245 [Ginsengibacter sp.]